MNEKLTELKRKIEVREKQFKKAKNKEFKEMLKTYIEILKKEYFKLKEINEKTELSL